MYNNTFKSNGRTRIINSILLSRFVIWSQRLIAEQRRGAEAVKGVRKYERRVKELTYQVCQSNTCQIGLYCIKSCDNI